MKKSILLLMLLLCASKYYAQRLGTPLIQNYSPIEYKAAPNNYCVVQDKDGILYFGNYGRILEYDGVTWRTIPVRMDLPVLSLAMDSLGIVYVSAGNEFGYLAPNFHKQLEYYSLSSGLDLKDKYLENSGKVFISKEGVYFQTSQSLVKYTFTQIHNTVKNGGVRAVEKPEILKAQTEFTNSYIVNQEKIFVHQKGLGLMQLEDGKLQGLVNGEKFVDRKTVAILPFKKKQIIICTSEGIFYYTYGKGFGKFNSETRNFYDQMSILKATELPNAYVFSTLNKGTMVVEKESDTKKRKIIELYNKQAGLTTEQINAIYNNPEHDANMLWLMSEYGISRTRLNSPLRKINEASQVKDVIQGMMHHNGAFNVRTVGEIYSMSDTLENKEFRSIKNIVSNTDWLTVPIEVKTTRQVPITEAVSNTIKNLFSKKKAKGKAKQRFRTETITQIHPRIIVSSKTGLYEIVDDVARQIKFDYSLSKDYNLEKSKESTSKYNINRLYKSTTNPKRIYLGLEDGLAIISYQNGVWIDEGRIASIKEPIISIAEDGQKNVWLGVKNDGVICISTKGEKTIVNKDKESSTTHTFFGKDVDIKRFGINEGLPQLTTNGIFYSVSLKTSENKGLLFLTRNGLYRFDYQGKFYPDKTFGSESSNGSTKILDIVPDHQGSFWLRTQNDYSTGVDYFQKNTDGSFQRNSKSYKLLPKMTIQTIYADSTGLVWISGTEGLYSYDTKVKGDSTHAYKALIRKVMAGKDSTLFSGATLSDNLELFHSPSLLHVGLNFRLNNLRFEFAAPFFEDENDTQYSYYLEGFDDTWSNWSNDTRKEYTNLPKRAYVFHVKAKNVYGIESKEDTYSFTILTPFYETFWFVCIQVGLFVVLLFVSVIMNRADKSSLVTQILSMLTVTTIFKLLGVFFFGPIIEKFSGGVVYYKVILDILIGLAILPVWSATMRLIQHGTIRKKDVNQ